MKVEVRPLDLPKWHGKKGQESFSQPHIIEALYDSNSGKIATGLTEEEAEKYGKELGVDLSNKFDQNKPHPFWNSKMGVIKLQNSTMIFDDRKPLEFVKIKVMKASKYVANSMKEWNEGKYPEATHVIYDEEEEVSILATKAKKRKKAMKLSLELSKDEQVNIVQILSDKSLRGRSQDFIDVEIDNLIQDRTEDFLRYAQLDKKELYVRASILEALHRNILTKEGTSIFYLSDKIGYDFESAVEYFKDPQNQNMKISILEKLNN